MTLLEVKDVTKHFPISTGGVLRKRVRMLKAVDGVTFSIDKGACFGIAGESGSGKTTIAKMILLLEKVTGGSILFEGKEINQLTYQERMWYRTRVQTIFQDAASSLNPRMRIKDIVSEPLVVHHKFMSKEETMAKTEEMLSLVGLGAVNLNMFPHELSGGQKQRVATARAIILEPTLVILDEPVSALDVSIRAQILNLLADIQERHGLTYLIIAHDLAMLEHVTTSIAVMYLGKIMEMGDTEEVFTEPLHPYTKALFAAVPQPDPVRVEEVPALIGEIGNPLNLPSGCRFCPRCNQVSPKCGEKEPALREVRPGHQLACDQFVF
jgi:oligopeptide/dipeptide ABC transporter ATP-binding protein